jgi:hypothetical protein
VQSDKTVALQKENRMATAVSGPNSFLQPQPARDLCPILTFCRTYDLKLLEAQGYNGLRWSTEILREQLLAQQDYIELLKWILTEKEINKRIAYLMGLASKKHVVMMFELSRALIESGNSNDHKEAGKWFQLAEFCLLQDLACTALDQTIQDVIWRGWVFLYPGAERSSVHNFLGELKLREQGCFYPFPSPQWIAGKQFLKPEDEMPGKRNGAVLVYFDVWRANNAQR